MSDLPSLYEIALRVGPDNPQLAATLLSLKGTQKRIGFQTLKVTIPSGTPGVPYEATFPTTLGEDFYVLDVRSTVQRPNYLAGSAQKAQSDYFNALNPGIDVRMEVVGGLPGRKYLLNDFSAALEIIAPNANGQGKSLICGMDAILEYSQTIKATFVLTRSYGATEIPATVQVSFVGWSLGCAQYDRMPLDRAIAALAGHGGKVGSLGKELADLHKIVVP